MIQKTTILGLDAALRPARAGDVGAGLGPGLAAANAHGRAGRSANRPHAKHSSAAGPGPRSSCGRSPRRSIGSTFAWSGSSAPCVTQRAARRSRARPARRGPTARPGPSPARPNNGDNRNVFSGGQQRLDRRGPGHLRGQARAGGAGRPGRAPSERWLRRMVVAAGDARVIRRRARAERREAGGDGVIEWWNEICRGERLRRRLFRTPDRLRAPGHEGGPAGDQPAGRLRSGTPGDDRQRAGGISRRAGRPRPGSEVVAEDRAGWPRRSLRFLGYPAPGTLQAGKRQRPFAPRTRGPRRRRQSGAGRTLLAGSSTACRWPSPGQSPWPRPGPSAGRAVPADAARRRWIGGLPAPRSAFCGTTGRFSPGNSATAASPPCPRP